MKKCALFIGFIFLLTGFGFSQEAASQERTSDDSFQIVNFLIRDDLSRNFEQIQQESLNLTAAQRLTLFGLNENRFGTPLALNLLLGLGIGSIVQGDTAGGVAGLLGDLVGITFSIVYLFRITAANNWLTSEINSLNAQILSDPVRLARLREANAERDRKIEAALPLISVSVGILAASRLAQIIFPLVYSPRYNARLQQALNMGGTHASVAPLFDIDGAGNVRVALSFNF